ncbi:MAG TPA: glutamate synthase, partial [Planctomycetota bacterium]|nr:glutamate synthase [Planctomycetota bacterium]
MSPFTPLDFETLLRWALAGLERERQVFGLPLRSIWRGRDGFDLSVPVPGGRADTPLGPAAGPHTQLAQNIVTSWLAGARVIELKTVQVLDRLDIARPCIDAPAEAYNVEWSQELRLAESLEQYLAAWHLVHVLAARGLAGEAVARAAREGAGLAGTHFDASVGYDLAG